MSDSDKQKLIEEAESVRQLFEDGEPLNEDLPGMLDNVSRGADAESSLHEDGSPYRIWNSLAEDARSLLSALEPYREEHAPPATPDDKAASGDIPESTKNLRKAIAIYGAALEDVIASGK